MTPSIFLKKLVMNEDDVKYATDLATLESIEFLQKSLDGLTQQELSSRLTLNCTDDYVQPQRLRGIPVMIMEVNDAYAMSQAVKEEVCKCFPDARRAQLKSGGNFPFLSRASDVNIFLQVHLNQFANTKYSALSENSELTNLYKSAQCSSLPIES